MTLGILWLLIPTVAFTMPYDNSLYKELASCLKALEDVYHPNDKMSDYFYFSSEQKKVAFPGVLDGEEVLFSSEPHEETKVRFGKREGTPTETIPKQMALKSAQPHITRALNELAAHYEKFKTSVAETHLLALKECEPHVVDDDAVKTHRMNALLSAIKKAKR